MNTANAFTTLSVRGVLVASLASICLTVGVPVAQAADQGPPSVVVNYGDLNLMSAAGVERLYQRIVMAARGVCHDGEERLLKVQAIYRACVKQSIAHAVGAVGSSALSALYAGETEPMVQRSTLAKQ